MKKLSLLYYCIFWVAFAGCNKTAKLLPAKQLIGVNGDAFYVFKNKSPVRVFKPGYSTAEYTISLDRDTIELGQKFRSSFIIANDSFKITITKPTHSVILNDHDEVYEFIPTNDGLFDYQGTLEYKALTIPFEYKFIVIRAM